MRHRMHRHQLGVKRAHREAIMSKLCSALLTHGRIETTLAKAKALRPQVEKIITLAKEAASGATPERALFLRRLTVARLRSREATKVLFDSKVKEFLPRTGGYCRITKLAPRIGDATPMALIELLRASDGQVEASTEAAAAPAQS